MKKRILVLNLTPRSAMLHYSSQFCNELFKREDIDLKVAIASYHTSKLYHQNIIFFKIHTNPHFLSFIFDSLNFFSQLFFLIKIIKYSPDIVHFIDNHPWYSIYVRIFRILWYSIYTTQHDPTLHSGETRNLVWKIAVYTNKILREFSDILIVHGEKLKKELIVKYHISEEKIISIPHWAYTFFNQYAQWLAVQKNTFLFFWRILDYKWLDTLLESLEYVKEIITDFHLIVSGPGDIFSYKKDFQKYKNNINIYNYNIPVEEAYKYFEISEFVVLPYKDATGSWVIPVAYCFKKPVIVTDVWELSSVVQESITWKIIPANKPKDLAWAIIELLQNKESTKEMWEQAYQYSLKELSWGPIVQKIYKY